MFGSLIKKTLGSAMFKTLEEEEENGECVEHEDEQEELRVTPDVDTPVDIEGRPMCQHPYCDKITNAEVTIQLNESFQLGKVKGRSVGTDGKVHGCHNDNHVLNTITCNVEFPDGKFRQNATNIIAEHLMSRVDDEDFSKAMIRSITDFKKYHTAVNQKGKHFYSNNGRRHLRKSTKGWKLKVLRNKDSSAWTPLKDLKESNHVDVSEFSAAKGIDM